LIDKEERSVWDKPGNVGVRWEVQMVMQKGIERFFQFL